jgi:hypothetical protein
MEKIRELVAKRLGGRSSLSIKHCRDFLIRAASLLARVELPPNGTLLAVEAEIRGASAGFPRFDPAMFISRIQRDENLNALHGRKD